MVKLVTRSGALRRQEQRGGGAHVGTDDVRRAQAPFLDEARKERAHRIRCDQLRATVEWPKPGRSIATTRAAPDTRSQIRRNAQRLSGHGLNINTVTADESALLSANRIRTPSHTRKSGAMAEYACCIHRCCLQIAVVAQRCAPSGTESTG